jgi:hypothetical protein
MKLTDRQAARVPFYCLGVLVVAAMAIGSHLGAQSNRLVAQCASIHGITECQLRILGR